HLAFFIPVLALVVLVISIFISHRIAGPEYRLVKLLEDVGQGDLTANTSLRKHDELKDIANQLGQTTKSLSQMIGVQKKMASDIADSCTELKGKTAKKGIKPAELN